MTGPRLIGLGGTVTVEVTGACPEDFLTSLAVHNVRFRSLSRVDELTVRLTISERSLPAVRAYAKKQMCGVSVIAVSGLVPALRAMGLRVLYPAALLALLMTVFWLQGHIWFIRVTGNQLIPTERILWTLEENGIGFWTDTASLDMNTVKNQMLTDLPELGWITINTQGGMAQVVVRERGEKPVVSRQSAPANMVAKKSGLITDVQVTGGTAQVKRGDVVLAGDLLISGVTDLDQTLLLTRAEGEVYARTWTAVSAVLPDNSSNKQYTGRQTVRYRLTIGKKTINFYETSSISYSNYDKIMESTTLTLPGGYSFPVTLTRISLREYVPEESAVRPEGLLETAALGQIQSSLTAGTILKRALRVREAPGGLWLSGTVECQEEIGKAAEIKE